MAAVSNVTRQKAIYEKICDFKTNGFLYFPREDQNGTLYVISQSGEVFFFNEGTSEQVFSVNGQPNCMAFDTNNTIYIADSTNGCVLYKTNVGSDSNATIENVLVKDYEDQDLKGPTALAYNKEDNILFIADGGNFMETQLYPLEGSVYVIDLESRIMRPVLDKCISYPADVLYDNKRGNLFIADTFNNRIIRLCQNPIGVFNASVFHQFNGRVGPTALAIDEFGNIYVGRYEFQMIDNEIDGLISVLNQNGMMIGELLLPKLPELTGIYISPKKKDTLYFTEKNSNGVFKIKLANFLSEIDKAEDYSKINV